MSRIGWCMLAAFMVSGVLVAADLEVGREAHRTGDYKTAREHVVPLAEDGNPRAAYLLGLMYFNGNGVIKNHAAAARWYRLAAEKGNLGAQNNLGGMYEDGLAVKKDFREALKWYRLSAEGGLLKAQENLARVYSKGIGVPTDQAMAFKYYLRAAKQGSASAQANVGWHYATGEGTEVSPVMAHMWWNLAAAEGNKTAANNRDVVVKEMSAQQIRKAEDLAMRWKPVKEVPKKIVPDKPKQPAARQPESRPRVAFPLKRILPAAKPTSPSLPGPASRPVSREEYDSTALAAVQFQTAEGRKDKYGYIDLTGRTVVGPKFNWAGTFGNGLAPVNLEKKGKYGYINRNGRMVIPPQYTEAKTFSHGLAPVSTGNLYGYIDVTGKMVIEPKFPKAGVFSEGLACVVGNGGYGFIKPTGELAIKHQFSIAGSFGDGLAAVRIDRKYGYIDKSGSVVIAPRFYRAYGFSEGLATVEVEKGDRKALINTDGEVVVRTAFKGIGEFHCGFAVARDALGSESFVDRTGKAVFLGTGMHITTCYGFSQGLAPFRSGGWGYFDTKFKVAIKPRFWWAHPFSESDDTTELKKEKTVDDKAGNEEDAASRADDEPSSPRKKLMIGSIGGEVEL